MSMPYKHWFIILFILCGYVLIEPYFVSPHGTFYSPEILFYLNGQAEPMSGSISLDGRTGAMLQSRSALSLGVIFICVEFFIRTIRMALSYVSKKYKLGKDMPNKTVHRTIHSSALSGESKLS